jgi:hypothetical protein
MRVLAVIAPLVGAGLMILFVLTELAQDLSRLSYHSPPDLERDEISSEGLSSERAQRCWGWSSVAHRPAAMTGRSGWLA